MKTLLQLIIPIFILWLIWKAFRRPKPSGNSSVPCGGTPSSGCDSGSHGGCGDHGGSSCDGGGDGGGGGD